MSQVDLPTSRARPLEKTLPSDYYRSAEMYTREKERIFCREWVCAGRETDVPNAGDYKVLELLGENILLVRNESGALRGFYNVCRHRGAQLCGVSLPGRATRGGVVGGKRIRCPYHSWTYSLDGDLVATPYIEGVDLAKFSLYPVGVESWGGFVFVHLTPSGAKPLADQLGPIPARTRRYPLARLRVGHAIHYNVAANWKIIVENYNECYHCGGVHPELCDIVPAFRRNGGSDLEWERGIAHRDGGYTFTNTGTTARAPFPDLNENERARHFGEVSYPNLFLSLCCDHVAAFILQPEGPERTLIECQFLFEPEEIARAGFDPSDAVELWDVTNRQDWAICESVQRGIAARPHAHGYYAPMEDLSLDIRRYVGERLGHD
jgi:Rieske 2Fe-2S family protein